MRGNLETIVGAMFAGKTSELLKRILWAKHQNKKIIVIKPSIDNRYSNGVSDLLKFIKFGYGRCTDHVSKDLRNKHMQREEGIDLVSPTKFNLSSKTITLSNFSK